MKQESNFKFENLYIGKSLINLSTNQVSTIINLTANSIEVYNAANKNTKDKDGKLLGISSSNWYTLEWFNRKFRELTFEEIEDTLEELKKFFDIISAEAMQNIEEENFALGLPLVGLNKELNAITARYSDGRIEILKQL